MYELAKKYVYFHGKHADVKQVQTDRRSCWLAFIVSLQTLVNQNYTIKSS